MTDEPQTMMLKLPPALDHAVAPLLANELLAHAGTPLMLDASDVTHMGALCMQVLLATQAEWQQRGCRMNIWQPSPQFQESAQLLGAMDLIGDEHTGSGI